MAAPKKLAGWRYGVFITGFVSLIVGALYPIAIAPMISTDRYKEIQAVTRKDLKQEEIQPGNMKVWTDPFDRKKEKTSPASS